MDKVRSEWAKVPSTVKVIIYSGISVLLGQTGSDLLKIESWFVPYATAILTIVVNVVSYLILREKGNG
jgi:hypothetical protein